MARTITLKLRHDDFRTVTRRRTLETATDLDPEIYPDAVDVPDDGIDQDCANGDTTSRLKGGLATCGCHAVAPGAVWGLLPLLFFRRRSASAASGRASG